VGGACTLQVHLRAHGPPWPTRSLRASCTVFRMGPWPGALQAWQSGNGLKTHQNQLQVHTRHHVSPEFRSSKGKASPWEGDCQVGSEAGTGCSAPPNLQVPHCHLPVSHGRHCSLQLGSWSGCCPVVLSLAKKRAGCNSMHQALFSGSRETEPKSLY
jgi:hypothetical protein